MHRIQPLSDRSVATLAGEIWRYRDLLWQLSRRQVAIRYKQTVIGIAWVVIQPLAMTLIFTLIFGYLAKIPSDGAPYPLFVLSGLALWQYFSRVVGDGSASLIANADLITKIYFPRALLPLSTAVSAGIDYVIALAVLLVFSLVLGAMPGWQVIFLPLFVLGAILLGFGAALVLAPLNALYRDIGFTVPFALQLLMYLTPVIYPVSLIPEKYRWLMLLNPLAPFIDGARWSLVASAAPPDPYGLAVSVVFMLAVLYVGGRVFMRLEATLVDRI